MLNYQRTIISQYAVSPVMNAVIAAMNQWKDPTANINGFYDMVWNIATAQGYGLDVWGRILGISRILQVTLADPYFGWDEATTLSAWPWNQGIFYNGEPLLGNFALSDTGFRTLLMAKAAFNIVNSSSPAINQLLLALFPGQRSYIVDNHDMSITYIFNWQPSPVDQAIVELSGVLPHPAGVAVTYTFSP